MLYVVLGSLRNFGYSRGWSKGEAYDKGESSRQDFDCLKVLISFDVTSRTFHTLAPLTDYHCCPHLVRRERTHGLVSAF